MRLGILTNYDLSVPAILNVSNRTSYLELKAFNNAELIQNSLNSASSEYELTIDNLSGQGSWKAHLQDWVNKGNFEAVWVISFPRKIPSSVFESVDLGFWNFHFGKLPQYRGIDPVFWQIRNGEHSGSVTLHKMDENFDTGPIYAAEAVPIRGFDTYGSHLIRLGEACSKLGRAWIDAMTGQDPVSLVQQDANAGKFWPKPQLEDLLIEWDQLTSDSILCLIRASNPHHAGAVTQFAGTPIQIYSASPGNQLQEGIDAGGILSISNAGIEVACIDNKSIFLTTIGSQEGWLPGMDWARFHDAKPGATLG